MAWDLARTSAARNTRKVNSMNLKKINANEAHDSLATTNPKTSAIRDAHPRFPKRVGMPNAKESAVYRATDRITEAIDLATRGLEDEVFFAVFENVATHCVIDRKS